MRAASGDVLEVSEHRFDNIVVDQQWQGGHLAPNVQVLCQPVLEASFDLGAFGELLRQGIVGIAFGHAVATGCMSSKPNMSHFYFDFAASLSNAFFFRLLDALVSVINFMEGNNL